MNEERACVGSRGGVWVAEVTEDTKVIIFRKETKQNLEWGFVFKSGSGTKIYDVNGSEESLSPEF